MGLSLFGPSSSRRLQENKSYPTDPKPTNFKIISVQQTKSGFCIVEIVYPNCTNYEGRKLLVFEGVNENWVRNQVNIDPHFREGWPLIARFKPNKRGWFLVKRLAR